MRKLDKPGAAKKTKSAIQNAAREKTDPAETDLEAACEAMRLFIELPRVLSGSRSTTSPCRQPWLPSTRFFAQVVLVIFPIQRCPILAKPRCVADKTCTNARMKIQGCFAMARPTSHVIIQPHRSD